MQTTVLAQVVEIQTLVYNLKKNSKTVELKEQSLHEITQIISQLEITSRSPSHYSSSNSFSDLSTSDISETSFLSTPNFSTLKSSLTPKKPKNLNTIISLLEDFLNYFVQIAQFSSNQNSLYKSIYDLLLQLSQLLKSLYVQDHNPKSMKNLSHSSSFVSPKSFEPFTPIKPKKTQEFSLFTPFPHNIEDPNSHLFESAYGKNATFEDDFISSQCLNSLSSSDRIIVIFDYGFIETNSYLRAKLILSKVLYATHWVQIDHVKIRYENSMYDGIRFSKLGKSIVFRLFSDYALYFVNEIENKALTEGYVSYALNKLINQPYVDIYCIKDQDSSDGNIKLASLKRVLTY